MGDVRRVRADVDVTGCGLEGLGRLAAEVVWNPERLTEPRVVLFCFPGGGMNRRYFDVPVDGYSMAVALADRGHLVVLMDHPALGDSDVPADPWRLTPHAVAEIDAYAVTRLGAALAAGSVAPDLPGGPALRTIGVGHSMGAMLVAGQQALPAAVKPYDALALIGHSGYGLPQVLTAEELAYAGKPEELRGAIEGLARARFGRPLTGSATSVSEWLTGDGVPEEVISAMSVAAAPLITMSGLTSMIPGSFEPEMSSITVPVLVAVGEHDIVGPTDRLADDLPAAQQVTVAVIPGASHNSNVAPTRQLLWDAIAQWLTQLSA